MKLEKNNDKSLLFSCTEIPDVFFSEYLEKLSPTSCKVYNYLLYITKHSNDFELNDISKHTNIPITDLQEAFTELEESGLIVKLPNGYTLTNLQEQQLSKIYSPKITSSVEDIQRISENNKHSKTIEQINNLFFDGVMTSTWSTAIDLWFNKYGFSDEVMIALFNYAQENTSKINTSYVQTIADAWSKDGVKTFDDLERIEQQKEKSNKINKEIAKSLGLKRNLMPHEEEFVQKWVNEYGFSLEIIQEALKKSSSISTINFKYFDTILTDWHSKELITLDEIKTYVDSQKETAKKTKQIEKKTTQYNYTQSTFDNLNFNDLYEN